MTNHKDGGRAPWISDTTFSVGVVLYASQIAQTTKIQVSTYALPALKTADIERHLLLKSEFIQ